MIASSKTIDSPAINIIAGDTPAIVTEKGVLKAGENLVARTMIGRIAATGLLVQSKADATDGSEQPIGVLVHAIDATTGPKPAQYYKAGCFFSDALVWDASFDATAQAVALDKTMISVR